MQWLCIVVYFSLKIELHEGLIQYYSNDGNGLSLKIKNFYQPDVGYMDMELFKY